MKENSRREFIKNAGRLAIVGLSLPVLTSLTSCEQDEGALIVKNSGEPNPNTIKLVDYPALNEIGGVVKVTFEGENDGYAVFIIRSDAQNFSIFSSRCTHLNCIVSAPKEVNGNFKCGCHGAQFSSLDGTVKAKPSDNSDINPIDRFDYSFSPSTQELTVIFE